MTRAKCRYGPSHESVALVDGEWWGEDTRDFGCCMAPSDTCPVCDGAGGVEPEEGEVLIGATCPLCLGSGEVPGPHWPWRHDHPGPLRARGVGAEREYRITHRATARSELSTQLREGGETDIPFEEIEHEGDPWVGPAERTRVRGRANRDYVRRELQRDGHRVERVEARVGWWWF